MKRILTALVLIPLVLLLVFRAPEWLLFAVLGVVALLALHEYLHLVQCYGFPPFRLTSLLLMAAFFAPLVYEVVNATVDATPNKEIGSPIFLLVVFIWPLVVLFSAPFLYLCVAVASIRRNPVEGDADMRALASGAAMAFFGFLYIGGPLACLGFLRLCYRGWFLVLFTFVAVWVGDTAAMYVGKAWGRHKFSPRISPNKTWEGAIASVAGAVLACVLLGHYAGRLESALVHSGLVEAVFPPLLSVPVWSAALAAAVINVAAQLGDLFESLIKRGAGVKDSGTLLPGHGGILDRIDALLFAAPVALLLFALLGQNFTALQ